jgi:hypothetical protein
MRIERWKGGRYWALWDGEELVCVCVYLKGVQEIMRRLVAQQADE